MILAAALTVLLVELWIGEQIPVHIIIILLWRLLKMTAQIILKDENGNFATIDNLSDWDLFRLINITRLAEKPGNRHTIAARVCRQYPDGEYRSLVTALNK